MDVWLPVIDDQGDVGVDVDRTTTALTLDIIRRTLLYIEITGGSSEIADAVTRRKRATQIEAK